MSEKLTAPDAKEQELVASTSALEAGSEVCDFNAQADKIQDVEIKNSRLGLALSNQLPNLLTILRVVLVPIFILFLALYNHYELIRYDVIALVIFCLAAFTDHLDGKLARGWNLVSDFGKIWDPIADKALMISAFIMLSTWQGLFWWFTVTVIARELAVTGLRMVLLRKQIVVPASKGGKIKTALQMFLVFLWMLFPIIFPVLSVTMLQVLSWAIMGVLVVAFVVTILSGLVYFLDAWDNQKLASQRSVSSLIPEETDVELAKTEDPNEGVTSSAVEEEPEVGEDLKTEVVPEIPGEPDEGVTSPEVEEEPEVREDLKAKVVPEIPLKPNEDALEQEIPVEDESFVEDFSASSKVSESKVVLETVVETKESSAETKLARKYPSRRQIAGGTETSSASELTEQVADHSSKVEDREKGSKRYQSRVSRLKEKLDYLERSNPKHLPTGQTNRDQRAESIQKGSIVKETGKEERSRKSLKQKGKQIPPVSECTGAVMPVEKVVSKTKLEYRPRAERRKGNAEIPQFLRNHRSTIPTSNDSDLDVNQDTDEK